MHDAYFAGFFDGEGCIGIARGSGTSLFLLQCSVSNTDANVLHVFEERFGGSVCRGGRRPAQHKPIYIWSVDAAKAESFLRIVIPHLVVKRERAELALLFRDLFRGENIIPRGHGSDRPHNLRKRERILAQRSECYERMRVLNRRGVPDAAQ